MDFFPHLKRIGLVLGMLVSLAVYAQPFPHVIWQRDGAGDHSRFGGYIDALGDQNLDGFRDFAVCALGWGPLGQASQARYELFHGGNPPSPTPYRTFPEDTAGLEEFGVGLTIGDVNGDEQVDWMTTALYRSSPTVVTYSIYRGGPYADLVPWITFQVPFSQSMRPVGDFNGDGFHDLGMYDGSTATFRVFWGSAALDTVSDWQMQCSPIMTSGDLNGDGYADLVEQGFAVDSIWVYFGGSVPDTLPDIALYMASTPLVVNDLNGDHRADLVTGLRVRWGGTSISTEPDVLLTSPCAWPAGGSETGVGDVNHDGWGDLVLSEEYCSNNYFGAAMLYLGSPWMTSAPAYTFWGGSAPASIDGHRVAAGLGDVNGDGVADFALGGFNDTNIGFRGRAVVVAGDSMLRVGVSDLPPALPQQFTLSVYPNPFNARATIVYAVPKAGGVTVELYGLTGRLVKTVWEGRVEAGEHAVVFEGKGLSSGVYLVRVQAGEAVRVEKMVLLK